MMSYSSFETEAVCFIMQARSLTVQQ